MPPVPECLGASGWQLSKFPILALAPMRASPEVFRRDDIAALREISLPLTGYLEWQVMW